MTKIKFILVGILIAFFNLNVNAQGVKVYKSDKTCITIPYSDVDSIVAYDIEKTPNPGVKKWVNLGLPSGVKWATFNVGATKPEEFGYFFEWGSISPNSSSMTKEENISGNQKYDAAAADWGDGARMPTSSECNELINYCTFFWTTLNNVKGCMVTGPNGNSIFLPAGNPLEDTDYGHIGNDGCYWSSSSDGGNGADYINFNKFGVGVDWDFFGCKYNIRPVHN